MNEQLKQQADALIKSGYGNYLYQVLKNKTVTKLMRYRFEKITHCNMCGDDTSTHKVLGYRLNGQTGLRPKNKKGITVSVSRCTNCGLIYSNPMPIPVDLQDHYGMPPENYWIPKYFKLSERYFSAEIKIAKNLLDFKDGMKALDIGAGLGKTFIALSKAGFNTYGFEPSIPFYERAISNMGVDKEKLKLDSMENVKYDSNTFDFITFEAVLEHLYDPSGSIKKAMSWLKSSGVMHIEVPSSEWFVSRLINTYYKFIGTSFVTNISPMHSPFHLYEFHEKSFKKNGARLGYTTVDFSTAVCEIPSFPKFLHPFLKKYMKWTNTGLQHVVWLKKV